MKDVSGFSIHELMDDLDFFNDDLKVTMQAMLNNITTYLDGEESVEKRMRDNVKLIHYLHAVLIDRCAKMNSDNIPPFFVSRKVKFLAESDPFVVPVENLASSLDDLVKRHQNGDWGEVDQETVLNNNVNVFAGYEVKSIFRLYGKVIEIRTTGDREVTFVRVMDAVQN